MITPISGEETEPQGNGVLCAQCHTVNKWKNRHSFSAPGLIATMLSSLSGHITGIFITDMINSYRIVSTYRCRVLQPSPFLFAPTLTVEEK